MMASHRITSDFLEEPNDTSKMSFGITAWPSYRSHFGAGCSSKEYYPLWSIDLNYQSLRTLPISNLNADVDPVRFRLAQLITGRTEEITMYKRSSLTNELTIEHVEGGFLRKWKYAVDNAYNPNSPV
jgi:hypothetical protein